jgi:hypothetical protein
MIRDPEKFFQKRFFKCGCIFGEGNWKQIASREPSALLLQLAAKCSPVISLTALSARAEMLTVATCLALIRPWAAL